MKFIVSLAVSILSITCLWTCGSAPPSVPSSNSASPSVPSPTPPSNTTTAVGKWRVYTAPDKSFSVEVPCDLVDKYNIHEYSCKGEDDSSLNFFVVFVLNMSDAERAKMTDERKFERFIKEDLFPPNRRVTKMVPIKIENGIGREILVTNTTDSDDNERARVLIVGKSCYEVAFVSTDPKDLESAGTERFLSSFKPLQ